MNPSPLQLERYFFTHVAIVAHPEPGAKNSNQVETTVEVGQGVEDGHRYQVVVRLKLLPPEKGAATYTGEVHAVGFFKVAADWPKDKARQLVETNGAAVLYGATREMVCNLTARGPWPSLMLPSVTFLKPPQENSLPGSAARRAKKAIPPRVKAVSK